MSDSIHRRANYGLDAPAAVRNPCIGIILGLLLWGSASLGLWAGQIVIPLGRAVIEVGLAATGLGIAICLSCGAAWMIWESKIGKLRSREQLLQHVSIKVNALD